MESNKNKVFIGVVFLIIIIFTFIIYQNLSYLFRELIENIGTEDQMISYIEAYGIRGILVLIGLTFLQIISFVIPAAPVQILAGLCYGVFLGTIIFITGSLLGNLAIFYVARNIKSFLPSFNIKKKKKIKWLNIRKIKNPEVMVFWLYLIPLVPNGILPYICSKMEISMIKFARSVALAIIPSTVLFTWLGSSIIHRNYSAAIITLLVIATLFILIFIFKDKIIKKISKY